MFFIIGMKGLSYLWRFYDEAHCPIGHIKSLSRKCCVPYFCNYFGEIECYHYNPPHGSIQDHRIKCTQYQKNSKLGHGLLFDDTLLPTLTSG